MINRLRELAENKNYDTSLIYLFEQLNTESGFFYYDNKIVYLNRNYKHIPFKAYDTKVLSLKCNIKIKKIEHCSTFSEDFYNMIFYNGDIFSDEFSGFVELCNIYSQNINNIKIDDFFFQLIQLFQLPKEENYLNLVGFYGELMFLYEMYKDYNFSVADYWHINGSNDKYDFCIKGILNFELKSTVKEENIFKIKHNQLFNNDDNYVMVYNFEENPAGMNVEDLINEINKVDLFKNDIELQIKFEIEKRRCDPKQIGSIYFSKLNSRLYSVSKLTTISGIPDCVSNIVYDYMFDEEGIISIDIVMDKIINR